MSIVVILLLMGNACASCYDESVRYEKEHPEWGCVTMSDNQLFHGTSHMVNYQVEGENLSIHDELYGLDYTIYDYTNSGVFFHFWGNETPVRVYKFLRPNNI